MARGKRGSWLRYGCFVVLGLAAIVAIAVGMVLGIAMRQNRTAAFERQIDGHRRSPRSRHRRRSGGPAADIGSVARGARRSIRGHRLTPAPL